MGTRRMNLHRWALVGLLAFAAGGVAEVAGQEVLHVYGSEGPFPAIDEAAQAFGAKNHVHVEVMSGPVRRWLNDAKREAEVIFCSAEFMMADLIRAGDLQIDTGSVTPLYLRPSAILVRPGNPKHIRDFPDLANPGVRVMVVTGSGQTGLWEDMAGKRGDVRTIRALRQNIVLFAADSTEAVRAWHERDDIDAWITWSIWHLPLRDQADLVAVSPEYVVYRQCNVALTERGRGNPFAARFVEFLTSPEGTEIFKSWDWITQPPESRSLMVRTDIAVVCRIDQNQWKNDVGVGLEGVRRLVEGYRAAGIPVREIHVSAVVHGDATYWVLKDEPYQVFGKKDQANPNRALVEQLIDLGVSVEVGGRSMGEHGWTADDILPGVKMVPDAYPRIADLQLQGYAYLRF